MGGSNCQVNSLESHQSKNWVASGHEDGSVRLSDFTANKVVHNLDGAHSDAVTSVIFSAANQLVSGSHDGTVKTWDLRKLGGGNSTA
jgi:WD40 repeat protein